MEPLTLGLLIAALAGGTGANIAAQRKVSNAQSDAYARYAADSDKRTAEAAGLFEQALGQQDVNTQQGAVDAAAAAKVGRVDQLIDENDAYVDPILPGQERAPAVIKAQISSQLADELARARAEIAAAAKIEGYSTRTFDRGLQLDRVKPQLGNLNLFAQGDRNVFDTRMAVAPGEGQDLAMLGDILTGIGQVGLMAGGGFGGAGGESVVGAADAASAASRSGAQGLFKAATRTGFPL